MTRFAKQEKTNSTVRTTFQILSYVHCREGMGWSSRGTRRRAWYRRRLLSCLVLASTGAPPAWAQVATTCGSTSPLRVETVAEAGVLGAAVDCTDGGTVEAVWAGTVTLAAPISVGAGTFLSITGEDDSAEVQGGGQTQMFYVSSSGGLTLTNLRLSGGSAASGGAVYASASSVALNSCVFDGNFATAGGGGAVWAEGGNLTIVGGEFSGNSASGNGGAVLATDAGLVIRDGTRFEGNTAVEGGGLYCGGNETTAFANDATSSCSLSEAVFIANNASRETEIQYPSYWVSTDEVDGGGAAAFWYAEVNISDSVFGSNYAQLSGGAVFGGNSTEMAIDGCKFENNTTLGYGAAVAACSATLGGSTTLTNNSAEENGAGVFGWDPTGTVVFNDVVCSDNTVGGLGGCYYAAGKGIVNDGAVMRGNSALDDGGCVYGSVGCDITVNGGEFAMCTAAKNGGVLYAFDSSRVNITGGTFTENVAAGRGAVIYCSGGTTGLGGSFVTIEGGTFSENQGLTMGGVITASGFPTVVTIKGGVFRNNSANFYGGFVHLEEEASLTCEGATIEDNNAGDKGGGIYAETSIWVNSSCDLIGNGAPQGAATYLTGVTSANFEAHNVTDNVATAGGSVLGVSGSSVVMRGVNFQSADGLQEETCIFGVHTDSTATLVAEDCVFGGWLGDTVFYHANPSAGSLVLNSCDFSESSTTMAVTSPYSDAEIRNALVGDPTIENVETVNDSLVLVDQAMGCGAVNACGPGECVGSDLGVLCECLEDGVCLNNGGAITLTVSGDLPDETYRPDWVKFDLTVAAAANGITPTIWNLTYEAEKLDLNALPSSGVLPPGGNVTISVTGRSTEQDVGGGLISQFVVNSVGSGTSADSATAGVGLEVETDFYLCQAFEYAMPDGEEQVTCEQCVLLDGAEGVDCELPGATQTSLPVRAGYWRSSDEALVIHACLHSDACVGATEIVTSDDYCDGGYEGPYCAVCAEGYGKGVGNTCHSCTGSKARLLIAAGSVFFLVALLLMFFAAVFLIGGLDAVASVRGSVARSLRVPGKTTTRAEQPVSLPGPTLPERSASARNISARRQVDDLAVEHDSGEVGGQRIGGGFDAPDDLLGYDHGEEKSDGSIDVSDANLVLPLAIAGKDAAFCERFSVGGGDSSHPPVDADADAAPAEAVAGGKSGSRRLGEKIKGWASRVPLDKLKILVVVWQILTVFPSITGVDYPPSYSRFLSWIDVVNFDVGHIFSASCALPFVTFYERLLLTTLAPIGLGGVLVVTYWIAKRTAGIGSVGVLSRRAAWSRHMAAGLLLTFLVFTSSSTIVFKTFACDDEAVEGESYLRADYGISCKTNKHAWYEVYAGVMIAVYPIGIPLLYAFILWRNRDSLNPRANYSTGLELDGDMSEGPRETEEELQDRLEKRRQNPDLVPSMFLWKDFGPDMYYYEVIECGRRILLTGALIFIAPHTAAQAAIACMFAFASLLGFELLRPHLDPADSWLYRLGCVIIFLSNFLALLIKADTAGEGNHSVLGGIMVAINIFLILAVLFSTWFATQQSVDDSRDDENPVALAKTMLTFEQVAAKSARLAREGRAPATSSALPSSGGAAVGGES
ncbi:unnamed protein product [Ectocarpus sp. 4 AP-2014]